MKDIKVTLLMLILVMLNASHATARSESHSFRRAISPSQTSVNLAAGPMRVYFFDGFIVPLPLGILSINKIKDHVEFLKHERNLDVQFLSIHNSQWKSVCKDLNNLSDREKPKRLILIGHSYGGDAAISISHCVGSQPVDLVVTIDTVEKIFHKDTDIVPENVIANYNYYESIDPVLIFHGKSNNRRTDGSHRGIVNVHVAAFPIPVNAHYKPLTEMASNGTIAGLLDLYLK